MTRTIDFPNLGIHLSVVDHITVFGFDIAYYGIVIGMLGIRAELILAVMKQNAHWIRKKRIIMICQYMQ